MYLDPANFRVAQPWTLGLTLDEAEVSDAALSDIIGAVSTAVDGFTNDHFEPEDALSIDVAGYWARQLFLPRRIRSLTSVALRQEDGSFVTVDPTSYQVKASALGATTAEEVQIKGLDYLDRLFLWTYWPSAQNVVRVIGDFSWPETPADIKRAVALGVWDWVKPLGDPLMRSDRWQTADTLVDLSAPNPTRIPAANDILNRYRRAQLVAA